MKIKTIINKILGFLHLPALMPSSAKVTLIAEMDKAKMKVSQLMPLKDKLALCVYDNESRHNAWVYVVTKDGKSSCVHGSNTKETIGMSNEPVAYNGMKILVMPSEDPKKDGILFLDWATGNVGTLPFRAPLQYSEFADGSVAYFASRGNGGFWDVVHGNQLNKQLAPVPGIVFGMVKDGDDYHCACDDGGLISSGNWAIGEMTSDINYVGNKIVGFLRDGRVKILKDKKYVKEIGNTKMKARRSFHDKSNNLTYWVTHGPQTLWVTNGSSIKKLADFGGDVVSDPSKEGSAFSSAVAMLDGVIYVATTKAKNSGWRLYRVDI